MPPKFGTSGLRGLVTELTVACVTRYVHAFALSCPIGKGLYIGHDLRASSPDLADVVGHAAANAGLTVTCCEAVPTPALAHAAMADGAAAIMVTGSHIPADRNGLKFYTPAGEITKAEEALIQNALGQKSTADAVGSVTNATDVQARYAARYQAAFDKALGGLHLGLYEQSAVGRDSLADLLRSLGAKVTSLGRSDVFVPIDTEAVPADLRDQLRDWAQGHGLDAIVSTDADGDRPLLTDEGGTVVPGDILGQITAETLGADTVVTPISSNSGVAQSGRFAHVLRTAIGSPHVIAGMQASTGAVVGYEANGGFLLGFTAQGPTGDLPPLMTRDAVLPILAVLAQSAKTGVKASVAQQPARFTAADRLQDVDVDAAVAFIDQLRQSATEREAFLASLDSTCAEVDETDGLRMTLQNGLVVHLRLSGNAPELRLYVEAPSKDDAYEVLTTLLPILAGTILSQVTRFSL
ncbi:phosphomannomutase [Yoonia maricola]|uniref:Phosphomannomutase n=1 Tax=Yoonia maricola TaxID=420999 RepID=A0A2M8W104_9RHOB|nr:phosphomannomutase [Yoonia maricola]PJI84596.1 phosphomannomutase [Yoonia maricola]